MNRKKLQYDLLVESLYGPEPLFVLLSIIDLENLDEIESFLKALVELVNRGFLKCLYGNEERSSILVQDLQSYLDKRIQAREILTEFPEVCDEYYFHTTDDGIKQLRPEDKPISPEEGKNRKAK